MYNSTSETLILNSVFYVLEVIALKTCLTILGIIPDSTDIYWPTWPYIVWVFPEDVWPYANIVPLNPSITLSTIEAAA